VDKIVGKSKAIHTADTSKPVHSAGPLAFLPPLDEPLRSVPGKEEEELTVRELTTNLLHLIEFLFRYATFIKPRILALQSFLRKHIAFSQDRVRSIYVILGEA
jgi:hypothetical protein